MTETTTIYDDYFRYTEEAAKKYGPLSVVLMQVGAFYEMYGTKPSAYAKPSAQAACGDIARSRVQDVAAICGGLAISEKKSLYAGDQLVMAGFRDYTLDKHAQKIVEAGFTVLIYDQEKQGTKFVRSLTQVLSAGTYLPPADSVSNTLNAITNHIMCVWLHVFKKTLVCGVAIVNILSGKSAIFEFVAPLDLSSPTTFDELERCVATYLPSELIFICPYEREAAAKMAEYAGIQCPIVHHVRSDDTADDIVKRCGQQIYVQHVLETYFQKNTYDVCAEFREYAVATQAYCYLLHFIHEHNANLIRKILLPDFYNGSREMVLANHTLKQLNIVDDHGIEAAAAINTKYKSVSAFLNRCCTAIGKRALFAQICRPVHDTEWLLKEYDAIAAFMQNVGDEMHTMVRKQLGQVADFERIERQLVAKRIGPESIYRLFASLQAIQQIVVCFAEEDTLVSSLFNISYSEIDACITSLVTMIETTFVFEQNVVGSVSDDLFKKGVDQTLDELVETQIKDEHLFVSIRATFNRIMSVCEKSAAAIDYVKVHETEKSGSSLQITKKRATVLKTHLAEMAKKGQSIEFWTSKSEKIAVPASEIRLVSAGASNDEIEFPMLTRILRERLEIKDRITAESCRVFREWLDRFEQQIPTLRKITEFVQRIDVLQSKSYVAKKFGYCRPTIDGTHQNGSSFIRTTGLRHCLIEHIQTKEVYVPNDISIGNIDSGNELESTTTSQPNGILLYGTNAVGKTSLIRALGIALIMAQAGMYVPAATFHFAPYRAIYSRILGNDNLFKNLSTFAVEMSELRTILTQADGQSLVLGDELCSGTESESALSIFMAGLMDLNRKGASFIFATHFHEILKFDEMREIEQTVHVKHMAVHYDREQDRLIYDRVLRDGPGNRVYGLEVAKALHLPADFIESAYRIRQRYYPETQGPLANTPTKYNAKKIRGMCEMCNANLAEETHHIVQQKDADERGFVKPGLHKNHPANLMGLCAKCHDEVHANTNTNNIPIGNIDAKIKPVAKRVVKKTAAN